MDRRPGARRPGPAGGAHRGPAVRAVVFDLGGVLLHWRPLELLQQSVPELAPDEAAARALAPRIFESFEPGSDWAAFDLGLVEPDELASRIATRLGVADAAIRRVIEAIPAHLQPMADSTALLPALRRAGHRLLFLSNMPRPYADHLEVAHAFFGHLEGGVFSGRVGLMKPDPAIFHLVVERFGIEPTDTLFVDDHAGNVQAARSLGWQALHFTDAPSCATALRRDGWL